MKKVYAGLNLQDARMKADLLVAQGIEVKILGGELQGALGELPLTPDTAPSVWVHDDDIARAREIIAGTLKPNVELVREPWQCRDCGELIEPQFASCWNCAGKADG